MTDAVQAGMEPVVRIPKVIITPYVTVKLFICKYPSSSLKIIRGLTKAPVLVVDRQYDSTEKTAAVKAGDYFIIITF